MSLQELKDKLLTTRLEKKEEKEEIVNKIVYEGFKTDKTQRLNIIKNYNEFNNSFPLLDIISSRFQFISSELARKIAVIECSSPDVKNIKGINSIKMGSGSGDERYIECQTCFSTGTRCTGHMGVIEFVIPFIHPLAVEYTKLVLECICEECGNLNIPNSVKKNFLKMNHKDSYKKLKDISKIAKNSTGCINAINNSGICKNTTPKNKITYENTKKILENGYRIIKTVKINTSQDYPIIITAKEIKEIFKKISKYDLQVMGFEGTSSPVNFIMENILVLPERDRPATILKNIQKPSDLTIIYVNIIKRNIDLKKELLNKNPKDSNEDKINSIKRQLFKEIKWLINNNKGEKKINGKAPAKTLNTALASKKGLTRRGAQSKRVDYAGRSVIGGAVCNFGWVILPEKFKNMTVEETVFDMNIKRIRNMARFGGIYKIIKKGSSNEYKFDKFISLKERTVPSGTDPYDSIEIGDKVIRYSSLGDDVYINRQPSLHRHSMIGCRSIFFNNKSTVQIHMSYTAPLNADFDGDEINVNLPQTLEARSELRHLMNAQNQIIKVKDSSPIFHLVFNDPTSAYLISQDLQSYELLTEDEEKEIINYIFDNVDIKEYHSRLKKHNIKERTPQAFLSLLFPNDFNYSNKIKEGIYIGGKLDKKDVSINITHELYIKYGSPIVSRYLTQGRFLLDYFIEKRGFSIGLKDMILKDYHAQKEDFNKAIQKVREEVFKAEREQVFTEIEKKQKEAKIKSALTAPIDEKFGDLISKNQKEQDNNFVIMVNSKAKGKLTNITRVMATVAQQFVKQKRPVKNVYGGRCLSYFDIGDNSIESRGFSVNSFSEGLVPAAFFFQSEETRIGLLDTALETAEIGALTKRISKVIESEMINYDGGVVDAKGNYTSLCHNEGFNFEEIKKVKFESTGEIYCPFDLNLIFRDLGLID